MRFGYLSGLIVGIEGSLKKNRWVLKVSHSLYYIKLRTTILTWWKSLEIRSSWII